MSRRPNAPGGAPVAAPSSTSSLNSNNKPLKQRVIETTALILRILLWPLRRVLLLAFPPSEYDGLSSNASAKASQRFVSMIQSLNNMNNGNSIGNSHEHWLTCGCAAAKQQAIDQSQLILVFLHSPLSPESNAFCQTVLPQLDDFVSHPHVAAMGLDIHSAQGVQLAQVLGASAYPLLAILQPTTPNSHLTVLFRAEGASLWNLYSNSSNSPFPMTGPRSRRNNNNTAAASESPLLTYLQMALARHEALQAEETARRIERDEATALRRMQDDEYQESLRMDRERQEQALAEQQRRDEEERRLREEEQAQQNAIVDAKRLVGEEPQSGGCMVRFVLPSGTKLNRRFNTDATIRVLKAYLIVYFHENDAPMGRIGLSTSFPRKTYNEEDEQRLTLEQAGLAGQAVLMVQDLDA